MSFILIALFEMRKLKGLLAYDDIVLIAAMIPEKVFTGGISYSPRYFVPSTWLFSLCWQDSCPLSIRSPKKILTICSLLASLTKK